MQSEPFNELPEDIRTYIAQLTLEGDIGALIALTRLSVKGIQQLHEA